MFVGAITAAAMGWTPIAAAAFAGAVLLILLKVISAEEAYSGLRPDVLLLIVGMVVIGIAMEQSGLAAVATSALVALGRADGAAVRADRALRRDLVPHRAAVERDRSPC